jgi:hypothetical protein
MRTVKAHTAVAIVWLCCSWPLFPQPATLHLPARIAEEADVLEQNAPRIVTTERLQQRSLLPPTRFRPRIGSTAEQATGPHLRVREVLSEFSFGALRGSQPHELVEFRQVLSVDGEPRQTSDNAIRALSQNLRDGDDRTRKRLLEEFAGNGLVDVATDYALIILAFTSRGQQRMEFSALGPSYVGVDSAVSFAWKQNSSQGGAVEFHGKESVHRALQGTLWVRAFDSLPLRVNAWMEYPDRADRIIRDDATVDYIMSEHGFLTPASVIHRHLVNGIVITENLYTYQPFQLFSSTSTISFGSPKCRASFISMASPRDRSHPRPVTSDLSSSPRASRSTYPTWPMVISSASPSPANSL